MKMTFYRRLLWSTTSLRGARSTKYFGPAITFPLIGSFWFSTGDSSNKTQKNPYWNFHCGAFCAPKSVETLHDNRVVSLTSCGEDSFVIAENDVQIVIGIADGVGSWRQKGIDPSKFSQSLMHHLESTVIGGELAEETTGIWNKIKRNPFGNETSLSSPTEPINAMDLIKRAFWGLVKAYHMGKEKPFGSSTMAVVSMDKNHGWIDAANLGDSGYMIIRSGQVILHSITQQHRFNAPYQLMLTPEGNISDCSKTAAVQSLQVHPGDLIIVATDGLWDNLFEDDILQIVGRFDSEGYKDPRQMAKEIVKEARAASERSNYESPFCVEARKHGLNRMGGKTDDITVVVAVAQFYNNNNDTACK